MSIIDVLKEKKDLRFLAGVSENRILDAEKKLGVKFSEEYRIFLSMFGVALFDGHEIIGLCSSDRLNVDVVTLQQRELQCNIPKTWYVIEEKNIDDVVVWQTSDGTIYQSMPGGTPHKISNSLCEYVQLQ